MVSTCRAPAGSRHGFSGRRASHSRLCGARRHGLRSMAGIGPGPRGTEKQGDAPLCAGPNAGDHRGGPGWEKWGNAAHHPQCARYYRKCEGRPSDAGDRGADRPGDLDPAFAVSGPDDRAAPADARAGSGAGAARARPRGGSAAPAGTAGPKSAAGPRPFPHTPRPLPPPFPT